MPAAPTVATSTTGSDTVAPAAAPPARGTARVEEVALLRLLVQVLTQRVFDSAFAFTALVLGWRLVPPDPSWTQLAGVGLYGLLALAILIVRR